MRVLFTVNPILGHFLPLVPIARALESAGHTVAFAAAPPARGVPPFAAEVHTRGFSLLELGTREHLDADPGVQVVYRFVAARPDPRELHEFGITRMFPEILPHAILPDLLEACDRWRPDLIISDNLEFAGRIAAEVRGIPHAALEVDTSVPYAKRHSLVPQLDAVRASVGLPPDSDAEMQFRYLYLVEYPREIEPDHHLPPTGLRVRRMIEDGNSLPDWVQELPPLPTLYATAGTFVSRFPGVLDRLLEAMVGEPVNLIVTVGDARDPSAFGSQPPHVHIERYIPQSLLMPYCDAVLAHGGSGTVYTALDHGLPIVNVPIGADQVVNAARCAEIGVGLTVGPEQRTPSEIREAVREVLANRVYRDKAVKIQQAIRALPPPETVVPLLERLAVDKQPFVRASLV